MSAAGFKRADVEVGYLGDPKMIRLQKLLRGDEGEYAATVAVHFSTLLQSWAEARRVTAEEAEGYVSATPERIDRLVAVKLLDDEHRIPAQAWERHVGPAIAQRVAQSEGGKLGMSRRYGKSDITQGKSRVTPQGVSEGVREGNGITEGNQRAPTPAREGKFGEILKGFGFQVTEERT
jgi:hypothetical protein